MKTRCFTPQKLSEMASGDMPKLQKWLTQKHLATCPNCAQQLVTITETWNAFAPLREEVLPLEGRHRLFTALRPQRRFVFHKPVVWGIAGIATLGVFGAITKVVMEYGGLDPKIEVEKLEKALSSVDTVQWTNITSSKNYYNNYTEQISYQKNPLQYIEIHNQEQSDIHKFQMFSSDKYNVMVTDKTCDVYLYDQKIVDERKKLSFMSVASIHDNNESFNWKYPFIKTGWQVTKESYKDKYAICFRRSQGGLELSQIFGSPTHTRVIALYVDPKTYLPLYYQENESNSTNSSNKSTYFEVRKENFCYDLPIPYTIKTIAPLIGKDILLLFSYNGIKQPQVSPAEKEEIKRIIEKILFYQQQKDWENYKKLYDASHALRIRKIVEDNKTRQKDKSNLDTIVTALHKRFSTPQPPWKYAGEVSYNNRGILYQRKSATEAFPPSPSQRDYIVTIKWGKPETIRQFSLHRDDTGNLKIVSDAIVPR
jgi:hypothetical protein